MKRTRALQNQPLLAGSDCSEDNAIDTSTDFDDDGDATYETDVTEPDDSPSPRKRSRPVEPSSPRKRRRSDETDPGSGRSRSNEEGEFDDDPLDDTGIDLTEIDENFDKSDGTVLRQDRIEIRWKRSESQ